MFTGIERTSQIKPIPELHSAPPPITFLPVGQVAVAPGQRSFDAVTLTILISPFPAFFHEPDWHEASANPVPGERLVRLTEVTPIWVLTGERLTGEITAAGPCLCTLPGEMVPVAVIAPTHQIFRAM